MANKYNYPCPVLGNQDDYKSGTEFTFSEDIKIIQHQEGIKIINAAIFKELEKGNNINLIKSAFRLFGLIYLIGSL